MSKGKNDRKEEGKLPGKESIQPAVEIGSTTDQQLSKRTEKTIFLWFDIGYTLLYNLREPTYRQVLREHGAEVSENDLIHAFHWVDKIFMREYPGVLGKDPRTYSPWYLGVLNYHLGLRLDLCKVFTRWKEIQDATKDYWRAFDFAPSMLNRLRRKGFRLGIISNWDLSARPTLSRQGLAEYFEHIIISSEVGCEKPGEDIFLLALEKAGISASQCLYVGDNYYDDAIGSLKVGMPSVIINRFERKGIGEIDGHPIIRDIREIEEYL
ncbi:MAG: HAD family hydrolase [Planctomycetota bacterium]|jgi:putative hydrolase of the HAD superfamily